MHILEKSQANVINVTMHFLMQAILGPILKTHIVEKSNKCNQCDYAFSFASHLRTHLIIHNGKSHTNATNVTMHPINQAIQGFI